MAIRTAKLQVARVFTHRCFYLFTAILVLLVAGVAMEPTATTRTVFSTLHLLVLVAATAAVARSTVSFGLAIMLALVIFVSQLWAHSTGNHDLLAISRFTGMLFYLFVLGHLLSYVYRDDVMTADKLFGAASAYLVIAVLWAYAYGLLEWYRPGVFAIGGSVVPALSVGELLYYSVTVLTSTGFGDIAPVSPLSRSLTLFEQIVGVLYVAMLIARLAGVYPPEALRENASRSDRSGSGGVDSQ